MISITPEEYAKRKQTATPVPQKLCNRCGRNPAKLYRCRECTAEAQRRSRAIRGIGKQTIIG